MRNPSAAGVVVTGPRYLRLATTLMQRMRLASPIGGVWEAADVQWWSRRERATDPDGQVFWLDSRGEPLAAVILTDFGHSVQCDVLILPDDPGYERTVWQAAIGRADAFGASAEFPLRPDNAVGIAELVAVGFGPSEGPGLVSSWLEAARRPEIPALAPGYRLLSRADAPDRPYPLIARNGPQAEERLRRCSLYRPELDLMVEAPDGQAAGTACSGPTPSQEWGSSSP